MLHVACSGKCLSILAGLVLWMLAPCWTMAFADGPTAPPHPLSAPLTKALEESRQLAKSGDKNQAIQVLSAAAKAACAELDLTTDAGRTLTLGVTDAETSGTLESMLKMLDRTVAETLIALDYEPTVSADLPEGFPPMGKVGEIVIKEYPVYRGAWTGMKGKLAAGPNRLFWPLFQHIEKNEVAMTAPVEMRFPSDFDGTNEVEGEMSMAFLYGQPTIGELGTQGLVTVRDEPAMTVVSIGVRGPYNNASMAEAVVELRAWLEQHRAEYVADGPPRRLAYNGPDVPSARLFSEVQIPIRSVQAGDRAE